jgi:putative ABC transport system permease protein
VAKARGVTRADPLLVLPTQPAVVGGRGRPVVLMGVVRGGLGDPRVRTGHRLTGDGQVVADTRAHARLGDHILIGSRTFSVVGVVHNRSMLAGLPVLYVSLADAQEVGLSGRPLVSAAVTSGVPAQIPPGTQLLTSRAVSRATLSVLSSAVASVNNSKILMWMVAAIIVAALLYVSALQRARDFAVLKALGSSTWTLFGSLALQSVLVSLVAAAFAAVACNFMYGVFDQPVVIPTSGFALSPVVAVGVGLVASLVGLRPATRADPAAAFGG